MRRAAGTVSVLLGLGFGVPGVFGLLHLIHTGQVWTFLGLPTYGEGPFQQTGIPTTGALLAGFLAVCVAEVTIGVLMLAGVAHAPAARYLILLRTGLLVGFAPLTIKIRAFITGWNLAHGGERAAVDRGAPQRVRGTRR